MGGKGLAKAVSILLPQVKKLKNFFPLKIVSLTLPQKQKVNQKEKSDLNSPRLNLDTSKLMLI